MSEQHNCGQCSHLVRTSPEQVFLLCKFWSKPNLEKGAASACGFDVMDVVGHCNLQPEAPACKFFRKREGHAAA